MGDRKTIREALQFAIANTGSGITGTMTKLMLENILTNLENGKTINDVIEFN